MTRRAVLVLGMHRSGTSAISRVVNLLGATGPARPIPPAPDNPRGFWEPEAVARLNDAILTTGRSSWADWTRFDPERVPADALDTFQSWMADALEQEFGAAPLFVLKDPRISRLLPLWLPVLERAGAAPSAIVALRHPAAVARSLAARNGFTVEQSVLLWLRHLLDAELATRGMARDFVGYDALLTDWRGTMTRVGARLGLAWPVPFEAAAAEVGGFLDPGLRHGGAEEIPFSSAYAEVWTRHAWGALCALERSGSDRAALETLDRVRGQFEDACRLFAPPATRKPPMPKRAGADLREVTLCAADSRTVGLTARALRISGEGCRFGDAVLFSDAAAAGPFRTVPIPPLGSRDAYSSFVLRGLAAEVRTGHALVVQWDGYVVGPEAWDPAFLHYDYIGAPWGRYADGMDVGNGGFSLRSRRLLEALGDARFAFTAGSAEDELIGRVWRPALEREFGIRFAPPDVARRFAYERVLPEGPTFGFHGLFNLWRHLDDADMEAVAQQLPGEVVRGPEFAQLVAMSFARGRQEALRSLAARWAAVQPAGEIAAALRLVLRSERQVQECLAGMGQLGGLA